MKPMIFRQSLSIAFLALAACSSGPLSSGPLGSGTSGKEVSSNGPTVLNVNVNPGNTIELNERLQPTTRAEVVAEVKDFGSNVQDVKLRFKNAPMEIPMDHISGTTWRAPLTQDTLQKLAVNGKTMNYEANIIAQDAKGMTASSPDSIRISVKTPEVGKTTG